MVVRIAEQAGEVVVDIEDCVAEIEDTIGSAEAAILVVLAIFLTAGQKKGYNL